MWFYTIVLFCHSYLRWFIIGAALALIAATAVGWRNEAAFSRRHERLQGALLGLADTQFLLGLALFLWLSPIAKAFFSAPGLGMKVSALRFFGMEHPVGMLLAIGVLHVGHRRSRSAPTAPLRHRRACLAAIAFLLLAGVSIPWPGSAHGRPLLRTPSGTSAAAPTRPSETCPPVYRARCAACHGEEGRGDGMVGRYLKPPARNFGEPGFLRERSDADLATVIRQGGVARGLSAAMPAHGDLSEQDILDLVACVRQLGNQR
jgi:cytochrome c553